MNEQQKHLIALVNDELTSFAPITLEQMKEVKLMNRIDAKYFIPLAQLVDLLHLAAPLYYAQAKGTEMMATYHTTYLDTDDHQMYINHQNGRQVREKIRVRTYIDTNDTFLEVKNKNNHGRTSKNRILVPSLEALVGGQLGLQETNVMDDAEWYEKHPLKDKKVIYDSPADFLSRKSWFQLSELHPHIYNHFQRITLVNHGMTERLTIDTGIQFHNFETLHDYDMSNIAIVELKRDGRTPSPMLDIFRQLRIHPGGFSKYCIGCALTNPELKQNNFKEKIYKIQKM